MAAAATRLRPAPLPLASLLLCCVLARARAFDELRGTVLRGCVLLEDPYVNLYPRRNIGYSGIAIDYLTRLQQHLAFSLRLTRWNDTWSSFIDHMARCDARSCQCDLGVGSFTMTNDRAARIQFVWPFSNEAHQMVSRRSDLVLDHSESRWFVFRTFSLDVWILVAACVLLHAVGVYFFGNFRPSPTASSSSSSSSSSCSSSSSSSSICSPSYPSSSSTAALLTHVKRFPAAVMHSYAHLIGQPVIDDPHATPSFHRSAWIVLGITTGLFLLTLYQASLTVLLFESKKVSPFRQLQDILDCNIKPARVAMLNGGASQDFWQKIVNTDRNRRRCGWSSSHTVGITVRDLEEGFRFLQQRKADYLFSLRGSVLYRATRNCRDFVPVGEPFFSTAVGFVLPPNGNKTVHKWLDSTTRFLREEDPFDTADVLARRNECEDEIDATITSEKLAVFSIMYVAAWLFLVLYRVLFLWRRRRRRNDARRQRLQRHAVVAKVSQSELVEDASELSLQCITRDARHVEEEQRDAGDVRAATPTATSSSAGHR